MSQERVGTGLEREKATQIIRERGFQAIGGVASSKNLHLTKKTALKILNLIHPSSLPSF